MTQAYRLPHGGRIDRSNPVSFSWDGTTYRGYQGDTLASALLANGVHFVGRSFKYHRPRGILAAGSEEPNALVTLRGDNGRDDPNTRATQVKLRDGLQSFSQNCWPSLAFDLRAVNGTVAPMWPAGFYYKTFMWPRRAWAALYEPAIRRAAGLGTAPTEADPDSYCHRYAHCDVFVVGAGPAGLAAARAAAQAGARVMLCDEQSELGGSLLSDPESLRQAGDSTRGGVAQTWLQQVTRDLSGHASVTCLAGTTAFGYYAGNMLGLLQTLHDGDDPHRPRQRLWQVRAKQVVLATGSIERPLVFPDNDRPGILLASAARTYLHRYAVRVGNRSVVYATHDSGYETAIELHQGGSPVVAIVDPRADGSAALRAAAQKAGIEVLAGHAITTTSGWHRVSNITVSRLQGGGDRKIACDAVLMAGGWTPTVHLFSQTRGKLEWSAGLDAFIPGQPLQATHGAGACRGIFSHADAISDGEQAGHAAASAITSPEKKKFTPSNAMPRDESAMRLSPVAASAINSIARSGKSFVDFQNDVCATDIALAVREGFHSVEHLKRYTTTGMATDQGKTSNLNALNLAAEALNTQPKALGTTTFRAPYTPVTFGAIAGEHRGMHLDPVRKTPMYDWAEKHGAVFEPVALWQRARYFPQAGEDMHAAVDRECRITREHAGMFDASTLGKIEVVGPDAAEFLNRLYTNAWSKLEPGRCRYGLMLREDGFVFDDGVVGRMAVDRFHVTTTTGGAPRVLQQMEDYLQTEFMDLKVWFTSTSEEWAVIAINGPAARRMLESLVENIDLSAEAFPHMAVREGRICGYPTRLFRVSFTGELGFEVNVPSSAGAEVWEAIYTEGRKHNATVYGTEAMHVMRAEKGYIIVGQETDGTVTPQDLGMDWAIGKAKPDFVGKRSLARPDLVKPGRKQLVGLLTTDGRTVLDEGAQLLGENRPGQYLPSEGHVTSSYASAAAGRPIAMAMLADGRNRIGSTIYIPMPNGAIAAQVVAPLFFDPEGKRLNV